MTPAHNHKPLSDAQIAEFQRKYAEPWNARDRLSLSRFKSIALPEDGITYSQRSKTRYTNPDEHHSI